MPPWSEAEKSWYLLTVDLTTKTGFTISDWYPKKLCKLEASKNDASIGILTMPKWLYDKKFKEHE